jgi:hypothetical protein
LDLWQKQAASADAAERRAVASKVAAKMAWWLSDTDLSGLRGPGPLPILPAAERGEWVKFWADVMTTQWDVQIGRTHLITQAIASQGLAPSGAATPAWPQAIVALKVTTLDAFAPDTQKRRPQPNAEPGRK